MQLVAQRSRALGPQNCKVARQVHPDRHVVLLPGSFKRGRTLVQVAEDGMIANMEVAPLQSEQVAMNTSLSETMQKRRLQRAQQQFTYQASAVAASIGVGTLAVAATYYRFSWHMRGSEAFPWIEMGCTLLLVLGGVIGMEMWARYAHKSLWHDFEPGWALHKSHHEPRVGPFEANDIFAIINALPAMALCLYGFMTPNILGGVCFGAGLGITLFGIMYMFVHDGLVHKRFPVGPIAELPYLKRVAVAHRLHHSEKYGGVPFGMFLGPQELEQIGAGPELDRLVAEVELAKK